MERTHHQLYEELCRLDNYAPMPDAQEVIHVPDQKMRHLIRRLRRLNETHWLRYFQRLRKEQLGRFCNLLQAVR